MLVGDKAVENINKALLTCRDHAIAFIWWVYFSGRNLLFYAFVFLQDNNFFAFLRWLYIAIVRLCIFTMD